MANDAHWGDLIGRQVQIQRAGHTIRTGCVEAVTITADALWVAANGIDSRAMYEKAEGYTVLPLPERF